MKEILFEKIKDSACGKNSLQLKKAKKSRHKMEERDFQQKFPNVFS